MSGMTRYSLYLCPHTKPLTQRLFEEESGQEIDYEYIKLMHRWESAFAKPVGRACVYVMDDEIIRCHCSRTKEPL